MTVMLSTTTTTTTISNKGKKPYKSWLKDGVQGGPSSMEVLISWLSNISNYRKWKREDYSIDRVPKKELLEEIIDKLRQVGIYHRLSKDVASKISTLQSNYRMTRKWIEIEGKQLQDESTKREELLKRFPYWDILHPVFNCCHNTTTTNTVLLREDVKMEKSRNMLYFLTQKKRQKITHEKYLIREELINTRKYFEKCLHEAGFSISEIKYFYNK